MQGLITSPPCNENDCLDRKKHLLFSPYIFQISDEIDDFISEIILQNGGMVVDSVDKTVSHVICLKLENPVKDIVYVKPSWIEDSARLKCLISPFTRKYSFNK